MRPPEGSVGEERNAVRCPLLANAVRCLRSEAEKGQLELQLAGLVQVRPPEGIEESLEEGGEGQFRLALLSFRAKRRRDTLQHFKDFYLKVKARFWPRDFT